MSNNNTGAVILQGNFPIPDDRRHLLQQLVTELNREQLMFLSGYFAGAAAATPTGLPAYTENLPGAQARMQPALAQGSANVSQLQPAGTDSLRMSSAQKTGPGNHP